MNQTHVDRRIAPAAGPVNAAIKSGDRFLRLGAVLEKTGIGGKSTLYDQERKGQFPARIPLPGGRVAWLESEVSEWMQKRLALRNNPTEQDQNP